MENTGMVMQITGMITGITKMIMEIMGMLTGMLM